MAKRKAGVKDIIYELDNDDLSGSSDEEIKKTRVLKPNTRLQTVQTNTSLSPTSSADALKVHEHNLKITTHFGGKSDNVFKSDSSIRRVVECNGSVQNNKPEFDNTVIFDEDIQIDSPGSDSDLCAIHAENKAPIISIRFGNKSFAKLYKSKIKNFLLELIRKHDTEGEVMDSDTDLELDILPEEKKENDTDVTAFDDNLFFVDTAPCQGNKDVPMYKQTSELISNIQEDKNKESETQIRPRYTCFNCDGEHQLKDCKEPRNHSRIAEKRRNFGVKPGRYHVEDEQKYGHLIPGRISGQLRHALGIKRYELPLYIYRMRLLGYPCGWMEEAKILPSGINMFDSTGTQILNPGEEEGEVFEPGSRDSYDIKKIHDFPGFNVPTSSQYIEESHIYGLPPMSEEDSKFVMLQRLAPNAMKAYKRKKLTCFPSSANNSQEGQAEMELDSGDEIPVFPSVPPLPDDEPPKPPSPPPPPPDLPFSPEPTIADSQSKSLDINKPKTLQITSKESELVTTKATKIEDDSDNKSLDDIEIIEVIQVPDIPMPQEKLSDGDDEHTILSSGRNSPSIDDLEAKKRLLLDAIKNAEIATDSGTDTEMSKDITFEEKSQSTADESIESVDDCIILESDMEDNTLKRGTKSIDVTVEEPQTVQVKDAQMAQVEEPQTEHIAKPSKTECLAEEPSKSERLAEEPSKTDLLTEEPKNSQLAVEESKLSELVADESETSKAVSDETKLLEPVDEVPKSLVPRTPELKRGCVKDTLYGAPVMNIASPFMKLPSDDKFAKDICDIIQFENLPNSVGKYKKISSLLKKVKSEVDRIQES